MQTHAARSQFQPWLSPVHYFPYMQLNGVDKYNAISGTCNAAKCKGTDEGESTVGNLNTCFTSSLILLTVPHPYFTTILPKPSPSYLDHASSIYERIGWSTEVELSVNEGFVDFIRTI